MACAERGVGRLRHWRRDVPRRRVRGFTLRGAVIALTLAGITACDRHAAPARADAAPKDVVVHVPVALRIARGLDELSVGLDPDAHAALTVEVTPGRTLGVAYTTRVFEAGGTRVESERHGSVPGPGFDPGTLVWRTGRDALPQPGKKYVVEEHLVLFETDVAPGPDWNPRAGHFRALLARTLRQAEE